MARPQGNTGHGGGNPGGHGVGIAMIAIFAGVVLVVTFLASDGAIFGQDFRSSPSQDLPVSESGAGGAVVLSRDTFGEVSDSESSSAAATPPEDDATLSEEERQLLAMKDFPWNSVAGGQISSNQDAFQRFGQQSVVQRPAEAGTEPLSISDRVAIDVDRRDRVENDGSDPGTLLADIIEIDIPIGDDDEEEREEAEERPDDVDDTPEEDQDEEPQDDGTENDSEGSDDGTDEDSSGRDSGEGNSGSGSDDEQSEESGDGGDSGSNSTDTSGPSEDSGSENDEGDGNSTGTEVSISLG